MDIKIVKLLTGEELLADIIDTGATVRMKNPVRIVVMPNKVDPRTPSVGFAPWAEFSDDKEFTVVKEHVVAIMRPIKQFADQYNSMFSAIINPNGQGLIIPGV